MENVFPVIRERNQKMVGVASKIPTDDPETLNVKKRCHFCIKDASIMQNIMKFFVQVM